MLRRAQAWGLRSARCLLKHMAGASLLSASLAAAQFFPSLCLSQRTWLRPEAFLPKQSVDNLASGRGDPGGRNSQDQQTLRISIGAAPNKSWGVDPVPFWISTGGKRTDPADDQDRERPVPCAGPASAQRRASIAGHAGGLQKYPATPDNAGSRP